MTRLVLTSSDSAGGCLLRAGVGDIVIPLGFRFVWDELPSDVKLEAMLGPGSLDHFPPHRLGEFHLKGMGALDLCERCEAVEFWFDPAPNSQLILVQLLDCLSSRERSVSKLTLFQADVDIAKQVPEAISEWKPPAVKIRNEHLEAASWPGRHIDSRHLNNGLICFRRKSAPCRSFDRSCWSYSKSFPCL
ncbi:hypothetical protein [Bradyrhizobium sp. AUGA SZCCT0160]|uniref:hypothetical protein n=1 Tax=Bradyrhizobium sp. AUGA SZCCT0160 TaxID=2807662 RepID=UPI0020116412|nr:hypothetical protein [Bradyrhizobium sp. AUGA SZCCT0160]